MPKRSTPYQPPELPDALKPAADMIGRLVMSAMKVAAQGAAEAVLEEVEDRLDGARASVSATKKKVARAKRRTVDASGGER